ncbi:hypothetical protein Bca52824_038064 [Brassica carinata]|uniref:RING-type domain-containing protein n=1 Tax=Brassica carinata TaxID=52824 RepID=A0A8X7RNI9_BRACI|nr:hypothetical protein Bca52824_038064 [Brassica carinata]
MKTASNGHIIHETVCDMEYMLGYHEIDFDSVMEIIEQTSDFVAHTISTPDDPTNTDLDIIVKISDHNLDAFRRIDLDVYIIELQFGTEGEINSLNCKHSYHHHCILDWIKKTLTCPCCRVVLA